MNGDTQRVHTSHEIGLVTAAKLVAICWAGLAPIVFPAWMIIRGEIVEQNRQQDERVRTAFATKDELASAKAEMGRRLEQIDRRLDDIQKNQQKVLVRLKVDP